MDRGLTALKRFAQTLSSFGAIRVVGVATSAVRDAPNGREFLSRVQESTGISLRILSGVEEAHYAYLGVASAWELDHDLVCDLGGGSLQIAEVRKGKLQNSVSLPLGVLRLTQRYLEHDPPKPREIQALRETWYGTRSDRRWTPSAPRNIVSSVSAGPFGRSRARLFGFGSIPSFVSMDTPFAVGTSPHSASF